MNSDLENEGHHLEVDRPVVPKSIVSPSPDKTSRAIKIRLMMLLAMLVAVIYLMKEAGDPDRWKWMGFDEVPAGLSAEVPAEVSAHDQAIPVSPPTVSDTPLAVEHDSNKQDLSEESAKPADSVSPRPSQSSQRDDADPLPTAPDRPNNSSHKSAPLVTLDSKSNRDVALGDDVISIAPNPDNYPIAAKRFWAKTMDQLSTQQRQSLFRLMRELRTGQRLNEQRKPDYQRLVKIISRKRAAFQREMFDQLALIVDGSPEKTELADEQFDSQQIWETKILPAFETALAGDDITVSQQQRLIELQSVLDPLILHEVEDGTTLGWRGDPTAWVRMWERVIDNDIPAGERATHLQLSSQPDFYRGRAVELTGWVRSAQRKELKPDSEVMAPHYYVMWMRPEDTNLSPYCVYALELPEGFPEITGEFTKTNEKIRVNGLFFKNRSFIDAAKEVSESPVILARDFEWIPDTTPLAVNKWQPSPAMLIGFLVAIPLIAIGIACWVFQSSKSQPFQPGVKTTERINHSLDDLVDDPNVQTEREKIMELYQNHSED